MRFPCHPQYKRLTPILIYWLHLESKHQKVSNEFDRIIFGHSSAMSL